MHRSISLCRSSDRRERRGLVAAQESRIEGPGTGIAGGYDGGGPTVQRSDPPEDSWGRRHLDLQPTLIPLDEKTNWKNVWDNLKLHLPTFALFKSDRESRDQDPEAQNPLKAAVGDLFNEGNMDVVVGDIDGSPMVLRNQGIPGRHWVSFELAGVKSNRLALNARIKIVAGGMTQTSEIHSGGSYLSQNDVRVHFGLGMAKKLTVWRFTGLLER